jgi:D-alanyl-lipoteichoic acid acyltransferase DltB (MBOAT superfamily)
MLFTSLDFAIFLPVVLLVYWALDRRDPGMQNAFLVIASYVFYGWWDWRFLGLIFASSVIDFLVALGIHRCRSRGDGRNMARALLVITLAVNLGLLAVFKYYNFFAMQLNAAWTLFGWRAPLESLNLILPVGISFYTFQTLSYSIDVYRRRLTPTSNLVTFLGYVSFFPQLVAGPIERATNLLPQFETRRVFREDEARNGLRQILWGLFKKVAVADACAGHVNHAFEQSATHGSPFLIIGALLFAFQIYGDFSGYSDIAIGTARLFGFRLRQNFNVPYFSRDLGEFWRRWHISLSSWFKDYVYIPLGGSRTGAPRAIRNIFVVFLVSGLWHGANWTFIAWGGLNALLFVPLFLANTNRQYTGDIAEKRNLPSPGEAMAILRTFAMVVILWIFFRAESMEAALHYLTRMATAWNVTDGFYLPKMPFLSIGLMLVIEWIHRSREHGLQLDPESVPQPLRWAIYYFIILITLMMNSPENDFIYFQF